MAKLNEILSLEKVRNTPENVRQVHLWADGSFFRAYEWSAWLCVRYINQFKVTRRSFKSVGGDMLFIGFPQKSIYKFVPEGVAIETNDEKNIILNLPEAMVAPDEGSSLEKDYQNWRATIPLVGEKPGISSSSDTLFDNAGPSAAVKSSSKSVSMTGIVKQLLEYSVENHTPLDCMLFIAELRKQASSLL